MYKIGYLGPKGTFSEEAASLYLNGKEGELSDCSFLEEIFTGIAEGSLDEGVVPVENSIEGSIGAVLDLLAGPFDLAVRGEVFLSVKQSLMVRQGVQPERVKRVFSHPQALAQCRDFLRRELPAALLTECSSTAAAARRVAAGRQPWAALGPARAAAEYGLQVIVPVANDYQDNVTRFWVVGKERLGCSLDQGCKTSLVFGLGDRPGALHGILREFAVRGINLTRIESRPAKKNLGDYLFFIDFVGGLDQPEVQEALSEVAALTLGMKVLGSYPAWGCAGVVTSGHRSNGSGVTLSNLRQELDVVDAQIVELLVRRIRLVDSVAPLKQGMRNVRDSARENQILSRVHQLSLARGGDPKLAEEVWRVILDHSVYRQKDQLNFSAAAENH